MAKYADLHLHSIFSDGVLTPEQLFQKASDAGLSAISITDHDTIAGCAAAEKIKDNYDVEFVPGVELSCYEGKYEIHVLGFFIDIENKSLLKHLAEFQSYRLKRAEKIIQKLKSLNIHITMDDVLKQAAGAPIARPHIATVLYDKHYTSSIKEAFVRFLADGCPAYEPKSNFPIDKTIRLINQSGGLAILAHPAKIIPNEIIYKMIDIGLDGIESTHPMHDHSTTKYYHNIASQYWLIETGGSDYHGQRGFDDTNFGKFCVSYSVISSMKHILNRI